jgi:hypothetical protein
MSTNDTIWEGHSQTLTGVATGGRGATKYRLTPEHLYFESGILRTDAQQIPTAQITDVDLKASMTQRARGLADVMVHVSRGNRRETLVLNAIHDGRKVVDLINETAYAARVRANTRMVVASDPVPAPAAPTTDVISQLRQLGELRDAGIVTPEEFESKKAEMLGRL